MADPSTEQLLPYAILERVAPIIRHAAHPVRLRILDFLHVSREPQSVTDIVDATGVGQAVVSQQLRILKDQGVLACRRSGNRMLYGVANRNVLLLLECIRRHESGGCGADPETANDTQ